MTARPPFPAHDPLSPEERELAVRLGRLDGPAGPSAALDARILAAARAAAAPGAAVRPRRRGRWPAAMGLAASFVVAVGLAWQLKPLFNLPQPAAPGRPAPGMQVEGMPAEVLARAEPVTAPAEPAAAAAPAAPDAAPVPRGRPRPAVARPAASAKAAARAEPQDDFLDEGVARHRPAAAPPAPPAPPAPRAQAAMARSAGAPAPAAADASAATGARPAPQPLPPVNDDLRLPRADWFDRIRARRDAGDVDGARESLQALVRLHPRWRVPADLRPLLGTAR